MAKLGGTVLLNGTRVRRKVDFVNDTTTYGNKILDLGILQDNFPNGYFNKTGIRGSIPNNSAIYPKRTYLYSSVSPEDAYNNGTLTDTLIENTDWDADSVNNINTTSTYFFLSPTQVAPAGYYMATTGGDTRTYYTVTGSLGKVTSISTYTPVTHEYEFSLESTTPQVVAATTTSLFIHLTSSCDDNVLLLSTGNISWVGSLDLSVGSIVQTGSQSIGVQFTFPENTDVSASKGATITFTQPDSGNTVTCVINQQAAVDYVFEAYTPVPPVSVTAESTSSLLIIRSTGGGSVITPAASDVSIGYNTMGASVGNIFLSGNFVVVTINYTANTTTSPRSCTVYITQPQSGKQLTYVISQAAAQAEDTYEFSVSPAGAMFILHSSTSFQILVTSKKNGAAWPVSEDDVSIGISLMRIICGGVDYQGDGVYSFSFSCQANGSMLQRTATLTFTQPGSQLTAETSVKQAASPIHPSDPDLPIIEV